MLNNIDFGNLVSKGFDALKNVGTTVFESIKSSVENSPAGRAAKLGESIRENGLQATAEDIVDDIKSFNPLTKLEENIEQLTHAAKAGAGAGKALSEKIKDFFSKK